MRLLDQVRDAEEWLSSAHASVSGRLRVDAATVFTRVNMIPVPSEFHPRFPANRLELGCSDRPVNLVEQDVDCATSRDRRIRARCRSTSA